MAKRRNRHRSGTAVARVKAAPRELMSVDDGQGWLTVFDSSTDPGHWQKDLGLNRYDAQRNWTVFACQTLIAGDMGKMSPLLMQSQETTAGVILRRVDVPAFSPLLRKPNGFQTWPQMMQRWELSKLSRGNTYVLKGRDARNVVNALFVLDPDRTDPLVAPDGSVYYRLHRDDLAGVPDGIDVVVPASEIIHDRMNCLFHPLIGLSPLFASALAATQGLTIQEQSQLFFRNASRPGGMLVSPQMIGDDMAKQYKKRWEENFGGQNRGRTAVLGNGLKYEAIATNAVDSELVKQLDMSAQQICSTYHVPGYKVGVGVAPTYQNAEVYDQIYYDSCLQVLATDAEALLDDGLGLTNAGYTFRFDLEDLIKMDSLTMTEVMNKQVSGGIRAPNEARVKFNLPPAKGGDSPMMQQQQFSLAALAERDASKPFAKPTPAATPAAANDPSAEGDAAVKAMRVAAARFMKALDDGGMHAVA